MTVRLPKNFSNSLTFKSGVVKTGVSVLEAELLAEKAYAIGLAAQTMEKSLNALNVFTGSEVDRLKLLQSAADNVYAYFVQREMMGFNSHDHPIEHYGISTEVLSKIGAIAPKT